MKYVFSYIAFTFGMMAVYVSILGIKMNIRTKLDIVMHGGEVFLIGIALITAFIFFTTRVRR